MPASYRGLSVLNPDSNGNYWTSFTPGDFPQDLVDITNTPTTLDLGFSTNMGTDSYNGPAGPVGSEDRTVLRDEYLPLTDIDSNALGLLGGALEAAFDFFASPGGVHGNHVRFELQGLNPAATYDLTFYGSHIFSFDTATTYSVFTDNTYTTLVASVDLDVQEPEAPNIHNRDRVAKLSGLSPQTSDILYVDFIGKTGNFGYLNALQIDIHEPEGLGGDYNGDGEVDAADYTVYRNNVGGSASAFAVGSRNPVLTGPVGGEDYSFWKSQFGQPGGGSTAGGTVTTVPEPATWALLLSASLMLVVGRGRKASVR
jgi:hypothetical protein